MSFSGSRHCVAQSTLGFSSPGAYDCPTVELTHPIYEAKHPTRALVVEGTADIDARFFVEPSAPNSQRSHPTTLPFSVTVALLSKHSSQALDWNQEDASVCGVRTSQSNEESGIILGPRITIDKELCCIGFSIAIPRSMMVTAPAMPESSSSRRESVAGAPLYQEFGVAVKAYDISGRVTRTNVVQFVVTWSPNSSSSAPMGPPPKYRASVSSAPVPPPLYTNFNASQLPSVASKIVRPLMQQPPSSKRSLLIGVRPSNRRRSSADSRSRRGSSLSIHAARR